MLVIGGSRRSRRAILLAAILALGACSGYPLKMAKPEWEGLSAEQQAAARLRQQEMDRYDADAWRCHREVAQKVMIGYKIGFGQQPGQIEVRLGEDWDRFRACMGKAGWEMPILTDETSKRLSPEVRNPDRRW
jgi:hypothetical protein